MLTWHQTDKTVIHIVQLISLLVSPIIPKATTDLAMHRAIAVCTHDGDRFAFREPEVLRKEIRNHAAIEPCGRKALLLHRLVHPGPMHSILRWLTHVTSFALLILASLIKTARHDCPCLYFALRVLDPCRAFPQVFSAKTAASPSGSCILQRIFTSAEESERRVKCHFTRHNRHYIVNRIAIVTSEVACLQALMSTNQRSKGPKICTTFASVF
mmetsp:Transcript_120567/g.213264  ORF Transcript_120567/g.213264 Transcript_120567/m.213264 type:complete len:213 (+) Transcript_120567:1009-1647(+)